MKVARSGSGGLGRLLGRLVGTRVFWRLPPFLRGEALDALGREMAEEQNPPGEPGQILPDSDLSEAEQEAALRAEQERRAARRAREGE